MKADYKQTTFIIIAFYVNVLRRYMQKKFLPDKTIIFKKSVHKIMDMHEYVNRGNVTEATYMNRKIE